MAGVVSAMLLAALDSTIVGTAMPRIIAELHGFEHYAAVTTVYMLAATVIVPIVGKISDLYGRKPFLLAGVAIFVGGSALCGAAASMTQLVIFRGIQGIGAGFSQAMAFTTIADLFPPARRGRASGIMGAVFGFASVIGPAVGGFLTDGPGWRWCFYVNLPIGIAALVILYYAFPHIVTRRAARRIDWLGAATLVLAVVPLLLALSWGGREYAWASAEIATLVAISLLMTVAFLLIEIRVPEAILPPAFFRNRVVWTSAGAATLVAVGMFGTALFIPLFIQGVIGKSATQSGAVVTPMMFSLIGASMTAGQIIMRTGRYKAIAVVGVGLAATGMFLLSGMDVSTSYSTVLRNMMVMGVGLGLTLPVFTIAVQNAVDVRDLGIATSTVQFLRSMGGALGAAAFGALLTNRFSTALGQALRPEISAMIPPGLRASFQNPQALMNPEVTARIQAAGPDALARMAPAFGAVRHALAASLHDVFLCGAVVVLIGVVFAVLLVDLPLRQTNRSIVDDADPGIGEIRQAEM
jgi:EmrB/QacA subfamily drug resistance transporter